jgi:drug/metabolite transporter (DMT)-like permease
MSTLQTATGIGCALGAAACFDGAVAWQALEARRVPRDDRRLLARLLRRPRWLAATGLAALGWPLQLAALSLAPLTVVQPALAAGLVVLLALGAIVLGERVGAAEIASAAAIIAGVAVLAWAAPERHTAPAGATALALSLGGLAAVALLPFAIRASGRLSVLAAGCAFACTSLTSKLVADALARGDARAALAWAAATGLVVLIGVSDDMSALQRLPATRVAPAILSIEVVVPVALAPLVAGERWSTTPGGGAAIVAGLLMVTAGVVPLASAPAVRALERRPASG